MANHSPGFRPLAGKWDESFDELKGQDRTVLVSVPLRGSGMKAVMAQLWFQHKPDYEESFRPLAGKWDESAHLQRNYQQLQVAVFPSPCGEVG
jgi:hypothetical protein